ncbi:MAG: 50S ribosomal protein L29 [Candidatus Micrarchaeia archaeon]
MAFIRKRDIHALDTEGLEKKLAEVEAELRAEISALNSMGKPNNVGRMQELKKARARINTDLNQKKPKQSGKE